MTAPRKRRVFPFTAVIGQEEMKLALLLNVIDPRIGGVMIMGDRGTGKSTTIRALADLLPDIDVVAGDPYNSSASDPDLQSSEVRERMQQGETLSTEPRQVPMVDLPLGATEDRLCENVRRASKIPNVKERLCPVKALVSSVILWSGLSTSVCSSSLGFNW